MEREYHAGVIAPIFNDETDLIFDDQCLDLREISHGRLYIPVDSVSFHKVAVDDRALKQLACFRHLKWLTFQDCQLDRTADLRSVNRDSLKNLQLWRTPITINNLRSIARLRCLDGLTLDATGLKGDWLKYIPQLGELQHLTVNNGDLSDGATESLARMKGVTWLELSHCGIDSMLGPAIARLKKLECLVVDGAPFDDEGMKHLTSLKNLKELCLVGTAISDDGLASLEELPDLWRLSIAGTKVGDSGLQHLSKLRKLAGLDIRGTAQRTHVCASSSRCHR